MSRQGCLTIVTNIGVTPSSPATIFRQTASGRYVFSTSQIEPELMKRSAGTDCSIQASISSWKLAVYPDIATNIPKPSMKAAIVIALLPMSRVMLSAASRPSMRRRFPSGVASPCRSRRRVRGMKRITPARRR